MIALLRGVNFVTPDLILAAAPLVLAHRYRSLGAIESVRSVSLAFVWYL